MQIDVTWAIARKELGDRLHNRWIWTVGALLLACALAVAFLGAAPAGVTGLPRRGAVMASLLNLCVYLVTLLALVLGAGAVVDEKRRGTLDLILAYPVSPREYFLGTFAGHFLALAIALLSCFIPTGVVLGLAGVIEVGEYLSLVLLALVLGGVFLAVSFLVSILSRERGRGVAASVFVWVVAVFVFDLALVGSLLAFPGRIPQTAFSAALLLNPADVFRLLGFQAVGSAASPLGLAGVVPPFPAPVLAVALLLWAALPLLAGQILFERRTATDRLI